MFMYKDHFRETMKSKNIIQAEEHYLQFKAQALQWIALENKNKNNLNICPKFAV